MPRTSSGPKLRLRKQPNAEPTWYIYYRENGQRHSQSTFTGCHDAAQNYFTEWLWERKEKGLSGKKARTGNVTVNQALLHYSQTVAPDLQSPISAGVCIEHLSGFFGDRAVSDIDTTLCKKYHKARNKADGTIRRELSVLRAALNYYEKDGRMEPAPYIWLPPESEPRLDWITRSQAAALVNASKRSREILKRRSHLTLFILLGLYTGQRRSAILQLMFTQNIMGGWVDLENRRIDFNGRRKRGNKVRPIIPIPNKLYKFLCYARNRSESGYVIEYRGEPIKDIKKSFNEAASDAGLDFVTAHTLRHTAITWALQKGISIWDVSGYFGVSIKTIEKYYGHHSPNFMKQFQA